MPCNHIPPNPNCYAYGDANPYQCGGQCRPPAAPPQHLSPATGSAMPTPPAPDSSPMRGEQIYEGMLTHGVTTPAGLGFTAIDAGYYNAEWIARIDQGVAVASTDADYKEEFDGFEHPFHPGSSGGSATFNILSAAGDFTTAVEESAGMLDASQSATQQGRHAIGATKATTSATRYIAKTGKDLGSDAMGSAAAPLGAAAAGIGMGLAAYDFGKDVRTIRRTMQEHSQLTDLETQLQTLEQRIAGYYTGSGDWHASDCILSEFYYHPEEIRYGSAVAKAEADELRELLGWSKGVRRWSGIRTGVSAAHNVVKFAIAGTLFGLGVAMSVGGAAAAGIGPAVVLGFAAAIGLGMVAYKLTRYGIHLHKEKKEYRELIANARQAQADGFLPGAEGYDFENPVVLEASVNMLNLHIHCAEQLRSRFAAWTDATPRVNNLMRARLADKLIRLRTWLGHPGCFGDLQPADLYQLGFIYNMTCALAHLHNMVIVDGNLEYQIKLDNLPTPEDIINCTPKYVGSILQLASMDPLHRMTKADWESLSVDGHFSVAKWWHKGRARAGNQHAGEYRAKALGHRQKAEAALQQGDLSEAIKRTNQASKKVNKAAHAAEKAQRHDGHVSGSAAQTAPAPATAASAFPFVRNGVSYYWMDTDINDRDQHALSQWLAKEFAAGKKPISMSRYTHELHTPRRELGHSSSSHGRGFIKTVRNRLRKYVHATGQWHNTGDLTDIS